MFSMWQRCKPPLSPQFPGSKQRFWTRCWRNVKPTLVQILKFGFGQFNGWHFQQINWFWVIFYCHSWSLLETRGKDSSLNVNLSLQSFLFVAGHDSLLMRPSWGYGKLNLCESLMNTHYILHDGPFRFVNRNNETWNHMCEYLVSILITSLAAMRSS